MWQQIVHDKDLRLTSGRTISNGKAAKLSAERSVLLAAFTLALILNQVPLRTPSLNNNSFLKFVNMISSAGWPAGKKPMCRKNNQISLQLETRDMDDNHWLRTYIELTGANSVIIADVIKMHYFCVTERPLVVIMVWSPITINRNVFPVNKCTEQSHINVHPWWRMVASTSLAP